MLTIIKDRYLSLLSWMVLILSVVTTYSNLTDAGFGLFLNSDTLGIPDLYNDVVKGDGKIKDWVIAASTQVFPDALLYTLIEKIFQLGIIKTAFVYGLIQVIIVTALMIRLYTKLVIDDLKNYAWLIPVFMSMFFLESFYFSKDSFLSFLPTSYIYHFGVLINMLIVLLLYFSSYSKIKKYSLIFLFSAIAGFSDKLFLVLLIAPFFLTLMVFFKKETIKDTLFVMGTIIIGTTIGFYIYGYIKVNKLATFQEVRMYFTKKDIILSVNMFYEQMVTYIKTGGFRSFQLVFTFLAIVGSVLYYFKNKKSGNYKQLFLMVFFVFFSACTICAPFVNGSYTGYDTLRYNVAPFYFASIIFAFFIGSLIQKKYNANINKMVSLITTGVFLVIVIVKLDLRTLNNYLNYYPEEIREIDSLAVKYKFKRGIASYWGSRPVTLFSHAGLKVSSVYPEGNMNELGTNINRYYEGEFNFIIFDDSMFPEEIKKRFKIKDTIITKHNRILLVNDFKYNKGEYFPTNIDDQKSN